MLRESLLKLLLISFSSLFIITPFAFAESVEPLYPGCETCPVTISYDADEARSILGKDGMNLTMKLNKIERKTRKIDLDGIKEIGTEKDSDDGYELLVIVRKGAIAINSILDLSSIKIKTDFDDSESQRDLNEWNPEIQLFLSRADEIVKSDNLDSAWEKMKGSKIYEHVNHSIDHTKWNPNLRIFLLNILEAVNGN